MKRRILIYDLKMANYVYNSTLYPSYAVASVSGYHKALGDEVIYTIELPVFENYDIVYINKDDDDLFHIPSWLSYPNVIPIGDKWGEDEVKKPEWYEYPPDLTVYHPILDYRVDKYPRYNKTRYDHFYYTPIRLYDGFGKYQNPKIPEGDKIIIMDRFWEIDVVSEIPNTIQFNYPIELNTSNANDYWSLARINRNISRKFLWGVFREIPNEEESQIYLKAWKENKLGENFRLKVVVTFEEEQEWLDAIPKVLDFLDIMRKGAKKKVMFYPYNIETFSFPELLKQMKRWTGNANLYKQNTVVDYMILDGLGSFENMRSFILDPRGFMESKTRANGKLPYPKVNFLPDLIETYPDLVHRLSQPCLGIAR